MDRWIDGHIYICIYVHTEKIIKPTNINLLFISYIINVYCILYPINLRQNLDFWVQGRALNFDSVSVFQRSFRTLLSSLWCCIHTFPMLISVHSVNTVHFIKPYRDPVHLNLDLCIIFTCSLPIWAVVYHIIFISHIFRIVVYHIIFTYWYM